MNPCTFWPCGIYSLCSLSPHIQPPRSPLVRPASDGADGVSRDEDGIDASQFSRLLLNSRLHSSRLRRLRSRHDSRASSGYVEASGVRYGSYTSFCRSAWRTNEWYSLNSILYCRLRLIHVLHSRLGVWRWRDFQTSSKGPDCLWKTSTRERIFIGRYGLEIQVFFSFIDHPLSYEFEVY